MVVGAVFGLIGGLFMLMTGDESARQVFKDQPMKFAAMEGLYHGETNAPLVAIGVLQKSPTKQNPKMSDFAFKIEIPNMLSYMAALDANTFVPGINDLVYGNKDQNIESYYDKIVKGKIAVRALRDYKNAKEASDSKPAAEKLTLFKKNYQYFGYGYYNDPHNLIPNVPLTFYSFHVMVGLGMHFIILFIIVLFFLFKKDIAKARWLNYIALWTIPLAYIAQQTGWMVAEFGRQPWVVQDLMPTLSAVSNIGHKSVVTTFVMFGIVFTVLLIAEIKIMLSQIVKELNIKED